jgi:Protein of unknown function DUF72
LVSPNKFYNFLYNEKGTTRRSRKIGDKTFNEETLPVESVAEYFEHFPLLEIDYTFYRVLLEKDGKPTQNFHVLKSYRQYMKDGDSVLLKTPQIIIARKLKRGSGLVENEKKSNKPKNRATSKSPLKEPLLRIPGQSIDEQINHILNEKQLNYALFAFGFFLCGNSRYWVLWFWSFEDRERDKAAEVRTGW